MLGTEFGVPEGLAFPKDLHDGKDRSNCELDIQCLLSFDRFSPSDPKHEPSPHILYPAEKAAKARQISLKLQVVPLCTDGRIILIFLELMKTPWNYYRITEWWGLEGTSGDHPVQPPCLSRHTQSRGTGPRPGGV